MRLSAYSFKNVVVTIDGRPLEGFWEGDDAVAVDRRADNVTPVVGVDGTATASISADDSVEITIKLQPNSPANQVLYNKFLQNRSGRLAPFPISIRDTGNGEGGSAAQAVIMDSPSAQFGGNASEREWKIFANAWQWNATQYQDL
jgi:hypothetical protein